MVFFGWWVADSLSFTYSDLIRKSFVVIFWLLLIFAELNLLEYLIEGISQIKTLRDMCLKKRRSFLKEWRLFNNENFNLKKELTDGMVWPIAGLFGFEILKWLAGYSNNPMDINS